MTVAELIQKLQSQPSSAKVVLDHPAYLGLTDVTFDSFHEIVVLITEENEE